MTTQTISLKDAVQLRLSAQLATDPKLREQLEADASGVIKPIIAELLGDDGEVDLTNVTTTVHIETGDNLHFVLTPEAIELDEVAGFASMDLSMSGLVNTIDVGSTLEADSLFGIKKRTEGGRCTNDGHRGTKCCYLD
jgi:hypothetical protein